MSSNINFDAAVAIAIRQGLIPNAEVASKEFSGYGIIGYDLKSNDNKLLISIDRQVLENEILSDSKNNQGTYRREDLQPYGILGRDFIEDNTSNFKSSSSINHSNIKAFRLRLKDTGWGYSFASYLIPFVGIYYAVTRKTITPFVFVVVGELIFFVVLFIAGSILMAISEGLGSIFFALGYLISFALGIYLVKLGINQSRIYAKSRLRSIEKSSEETENLVDSKLDNKINLDSDDKVVDEYEPVVDKINSFIQSIPEKSKNTGKKLDKNFSKLVQSIPNKPKANNEMDELEVRLERLKNMFDKGLISEEEYKAMRKKILEL